MTKREETIAFLTKGIGHADKKKLAAFWSGKGTISGDLYIKYQDKIEEFDRIMSRESTLDEFLEEIKRQY